MQKNKGRNGGCLHVENSKLLEKSKENQEAAKLLAEKEMYNAATSRIYYSGYQKIIHVYEYHVMQQMSHSHVRAIQDLIGIFNVVSPIDRDGILKLQDARELRNKGDYRNGSITKAEYEEIEYDIGQALEILQSYVDIKKR